MVLVVYVDDILLTSDDDSFIFVTFIGHLYQEFVIWDLHTPCYILGTKFHCQHGKLVISRRRYAQGILQEIGLLRYKIGIFTICGLTMFLDIDSLLMNLVFLAK